MPAHTMPLKTRKTKDEGTAFLPQVCRVTRRLANRKATDGDRDGRGVETESAWKPDARLLAPSGAH